MKEYISTIALALGVIILLTISVSGIRRVTDNPVEIRSVSVPKVLTEAGYSREAISLIVWDNVGKIQNFEPPDTFVVKFHESLQSQAQPFAKTGVEGKSAFQIMATGHGSIKPSINFLPEGRAVELADPSSGVSTNWVEEFLRFLLGIHKNVVDISITCASPQCNDDGYIFTSRFDVSKRVFHSSQVQSRDVEDLLHRAAVSLVRELNPYALAHYVYSFDGNLRGSRNIAESLVAKGGTDAAWSALLLGQLAESEGKIDEAVSWYQVSSFSDAHLRSEFPIGLLGIASIKFRSSVERGDIHGVRQAEREYQYLAKRFPNFSAVSSSWGRDTLYLATMVAPNRSLGRKLGLSLFLAEYDRGVLKIIEGARDHFELALTLEGENAVTQYNLGIATYYQGLMRARIASGISNEFNSRDEPDREMVDAFNNMVSGISFLKKSVELDPNATDLQDGMNFIISHFSRLPERDKFLEIDTECELLYGIVNPFLMTSIIRVEENIKAWVQSMDHCSESIFIEYMKEYSRR